MYDLLSEPLLRVRFGTRRSSLSLPDLLAQIWATREDFELSYLRPHQLHPAHCFLAQLMALALRHGKATDGAAVTATQWRSWLEALGGGVEAWHLITADRTKPAILQGIITTSPNFGEKISPDEIDVPFTGRNWELKSEQMLRAGPDQWLYALISNQTANGYSGPGLNGSFRMNGAYGSRTGFGFAPAAGGWAAHLRRDVRMLLACHDEIATTHGYAITGGSALLWTKPWNGTEAESAKIETIDPFVIENARIIRLAEQNGRIIAFTAGTKALRVAAKERAGVVGDPWLAILAKAKKPAGKVPKAGKASKVEEPAPAADDGESKSLSIQAFGYDVMQVLALLDESVCVLPPAARIYSFDEERLVLWGRGVAREQGGTQGAHDQQYEVPSGFRAIWSDPAGKTKLAERAAALLADVTHARNKCVFPAAVKLLRAGDAPADNRVSKATDRFMALVRERLAAPLLDFLVMEDSAGTKQWREILMGAAHTVIDAAMDSSPLGGRRFEACSIAANMLAAGFRPWRETAAANATT